MFDVVHAACSTHTHPYTTAMLMSTVIITAIITIMTITITHKNARTRTHKHANMHAVVSLPQAARAAQFEKEDVLKNYRGLHAEKRRLEAGVDELQLTRQRLTKVFFFSFALSMM